MFTVTLINLSPDLHTADPDLGPHDLGAVEPRHLEELLATFRELDPIQNHVAEPQIHITSPRGRYLVRTDQAKLFLYDARDSSVAYLQLTPAEIIDELGAARSGPTGSARSSDPASAGEPDPAGTSWRRRTLALALLGACVLLNAYTFTSALRPRDAEGSPPLRPVTDDHEILALRLSAVGRYATGNKPGDRTIELRADREVRFGRVLAAGERTVAVDVYRFARGNSGDLCLTTPHQGVIEIRNIDTVVYDGDTYQRPR